jgi:hypothetical protein
MRTNVIGYGTVGKVQELLSKRLRPEVFVSDLYVFPNIVTSTRVGLSFLRTLRDFVVDAVKDAQLVSKDFLCVLIAFWNKADCLIKRLELNNGEAARLVCADARIPKCGTSKFDQPCRAKRLPTCVYELTNAFCRGALNPLFFEAVRTYNLRIEKRHANT